MHMYNYVWLSNFCIFFVHNLQRHHFELELLDGNFPIPSKPYLYMQHKTRVHQILQDDPEGFNTQMKEYVKGKMF